MKTLIIKDLSLTAELDGKAMAAVHGGWKMPSYASSFVYSPQSDSSVHATQNLFQDQKVVNATANDSAFLDNIHVTNNTSQFGQNNIYA